MATWNEVVEMLKEDNVNIQWNIGFSRPGLPSYHMDNTKILEDSVSITESVLTGREIKFGKFEQSQLIFKYIDDENKYYLDLAEKEIRVSASICDMETSEIIETINMGYYKISSKTVDDDGVTTIAAYSLFFDDRKTSAGFNKSVTIAGQNEKFNKNLGYLYYSILQELGIDNALNELSAWTKVDMVANGTTYSPPDYYKIIDGEQRKFRNVFYEYEASIPDSADLRDFYMYAPKAVGNIEDMEKWCDGIEDTKTYYNASTQLTKDWCVCGCLRDNHITKIKCYGSMKVFEIFPDTFLPVEYLEIQILSEPTVYWTLTELGRPFFYPPITNADSDFTIRVSGTDVTDFSNNTYQELLEGVLECFAVIPVSNRNLSANISVQKFFLYDFNIDALYPQTGLYPSTSLYPNGSILLYDKSMWYLKGLDYIKEVEPHFKNLIVYVDTLSFPPDIVGIVNGTYTSTINASGLVDYDMSENVILTKLNSVFGVSQISNIITKLAPIKFDSFSLQAIGLPNVVPGSKISIQAQDGTQVESYIMTRKLTGTKLLQDKLANNITGGL